MMKIIRVLFLLIGTWFLVSCQQDQTSGDNGVSAGSASADEKVYKWKLITSWPKNYPGLGLAPENFAKLVNEMSNERLQIKVSGAGEIVSALEVFDQVSQGAVQMGHSAAYYWKGKNPAMAFFTSVPFGLTAQEMNGWLYYGGGLELWRELYSQYNLVPFPAGNTGVQMGGWYNKEINEVADLKGLKMRIPGIGGAVMSDLGVAVQNIPGGEVYTALERGRVDAVEWVGPYNDRAFGLHKIAKYYYYPGWQEPGPTLELMVNKEAYESLPKDLQVIVEAAAKAVNLDMLSEYVARNNQSLQQLIDAGVHVRQFPEDVMLALAQGTESVLSNMVADDAFAKKVYKSFSDYKKGAMNYSAISEQAMMKARQQVQ